MLFEQFIINFLYFIIQYIAYTPFIILLTQNRTEITKCALFACFCALFSSFFSLELKNYAISNLFYMLLICISSVSVFNVNKLSALFFTVICSFTSFITNIFCLSLNIPSSSNCFILYNSILVLIIAIILYRLLYTYDISNLINYIKEMPEIHFLIYVILLSFDFTEIQEINSSYISLIIQLNLILFMLQITKAFYRIKNFKLIITNSKFEYNKLKSVIDDIRMFKHDYNNTLCSIGGYIALNDMNGLNRFYQKLTLDMNKINTTQQINPYCINEPSIYNLFITKHNDIIKKHLKFNFYSSINYKKLNISAYDFSKILGIFLDNAIDAAYNSSEKEISVVCEINKNKDYQIIIKNSYTNKDVDVDKIFLKGYSSKKIKSGLRLMGSFKYYKIYT